MRLMRLSSQLCAFLMIFLFIACSSTKFPSIWKDPTYKGHPEKILVISTFPYPGTRKLFEDQLVKTLKDNRIEAVVSYTVIPDPIVSDQDALVAQAKETDVDTVLINSPVAAGMDEFGAYKYLKTQSDVYDLKSDRLVFSASAELWIRQGEPYVPQIQNYIQDLVHKLPH
jgi:hypothetical protein